MEFQTKAIYGKYAPEGCIVLRASRCSRRKYLVTLRMLGSLDAFSSLLTAAQISE